MIPLSHTGTGIDTEQYVLTVTSRGYAKVTASSDIPMSARSGKGVMAINLSERHGSVVAALVVNHHDHVMVVTSKGQIIRFAIDELHASIRSMQGALAFDIDDDETVVSAERIVEENTL